MAHHDLAKHVLAITLWFINDDWVIQQCLVGVLLLSKISSSEEIARELIYIVSVNYRVQSTQLIGAMRDHASANNVAMQTEEVAYPYVQDISCFFTHDRSSRQPLMTNSLNVL